MTMPDWLAPTQTTGLPDWLSVHPRREAPSLLTPRGSSEEGRALLFRQYETVLPRVLEMVCEGYTVNAALKELPIAVDAGAFIRWLRKQPKYYEMYREAKEIRTETWAGEIIRHAKGEDEDGNPSMEDTTRSRLVVDSYKWLMAADNRKQYGDTKTIEMNTSISITAALAQANERVIEASVVDDDIDVIDATEYKHLTSGEDDDE